MTIHKKNFLLHCICILSFPIYALSPSKTPINGYIYKTTLSSAGYTISEPGYYLVAEDIAFAGNNNSTAITTATSHVTIDFNMHAIYKTGSNTNVSCIEINPELHNITIKNGTISDFNGYGIITNAGASNAGSFNITIEDMYITTGTCNNGILLKGRSGSGNEVHDVTLNNCILTELSTTQNSIVLLEYCDAVNINDCAFNNNTSNEAIVTCTNSNNISFNRCGFNNNTLSSSNALYVLLLETTTGCIIDNCFCNVNSGNYTLNNMYVNNSEGTLLKNNILQTNSTSNEDCYGITLNNGNGNRIETCNCSQIITDDSGKIASGFTITGTAHVVIDNIAQAIDSEETGTAYGFYLKEAQDCLVENCLALATTAGAAVGIFIDSASDNSTLKKCEAFGNEDDGINNDSTSSIIVGCIAGNNTTNDYAGTSAANTTTVQKLGDTTVTVEKWANIEIT